MAILTFSGRTAMAVSLRVRPIHLAWGSGNAAWDTTPVAETPEDTTLVAEVGRRKATFVEYLTPDENGGILLGGRNFSVSVAPTNIMHMRFDFEANEAVGSVIRELAVFIGTETRAGLPPGQEYFVPADVTNPGILLALERIPKITRLNTVRQSFDYVIII